MSDSNPASSPVNSESRARAWAARGNLTMRFGEQAQACFSALQLTEPEFAEELEVDLRFGKWDRERQVPVSDYCLSLIQSLIGKLAPWKTRPTWERVWVHRRGVIARIVLSEAAGVMVIEKMSRVNELDDPTRPGGGGGAAKPRPLPTPPDALSTIVDFAAFNSTRVVPTDDTAPGLVLVFPRDEYFCGYATRSVSDLLVYAIMLRRIYVPAWLALGAASFAAFASSIFGAWSITEKLF